MAVAIEGGHAVPALAHQVHLLHTALIAATQTSVGVAEPSTGAVTTPEFDATFTATQPLFGPRQRQTSGPRRASPSTAPPSGLRSHD